MHIRPLSRRAKQKGTNVIGLSKTAFFLESKLPRRTFWKDREIKPPKNQEKNLACFSRSRPSACVPAKLVLPSTFTDWSSLLQLALLARLEVRTELLVHASKATGSRWIVCVLKLEEHRVRRDINRVIGWTQSFSLEGLNALWALPNLTTLNSRIWLYPIASSELKKAENTRNVMAPWSNIYNLIAPSHLAWLGGLPISYRSDLQAGASFSVQCDSQWTPLHAHWRPCYRYLCSVVLCLCTRSVFIMCHTSGGSQLSACAPIETFASPLLSGLNSGIEETSALIDSFCEIETLQILRFDETSVPQCILCSCGTLCSFAEWDEDTRGLWISVTMSSSCVLYG